VAPNLGEARLPAHGAPLARAGGSVVLIGMPGAGKSTVGVLLAKHLGLRFIDTDVLIQERAGQLLQQILDDGGYLQLRRLEEEAVLGIDALQAVIATGGSVVYSDRAMHHLARKGTLVYLKASLDLLVSRIDDYGRRGIANPQGQSFGDIFRERTPRYEQYADAVVEVDGIGHEAVVRAITAVLRTSGSRPQVAPGASPSRDDG